MTDESVCLDAPDHDTQHKTPKVKIMACSGHDRQKWRYDEQVCFEFLPVFVYKLWINSESLFCPFQSKTFVHVSSGMCLQSKNDEGPVIAACTKNIDQKWLLESIPWK